MTQHGNSGCSLYLTMDMLMLGYTKLLTFSERKPGTGGVKSL